MNRPFEGLTPAERQALATEAIQSARQALQQQDKASARRFAQRATSLSPEREDGWLLMAVLARPQASLAYLEQALRVNPTSQRARKGMDWALERLQAEGAAVRPPVTQAVPPARRNPAPAPTSPRGIEPEASLSAAQPAQARGGIRGLRMSAKFLMRWQNLLGLTLVVAFILIAILAPYLAPPPEGKEIPTFRVVTSLKGGLPFPPSKEALLGTIAVGIGRRQLDVFYTLIWGARSALRFGLATATLTALIGVLVGALSAFVGGWAKSLMMRVTDAFLAFPVIAGVVFFQQLLNLSNAYAFKQEISMTETAPGIIPLVAFFKWIDPVMLALILFSWMPYARLTYTQVLNIRHSEFVQAAQALGASSSRIIFRHLIPNSIAPAIVLATSQVGGMVLLQATLSFIGIDAGSEWGEILAIGRRWIIGPLNSPLAYWWVFLPITAALVLFGMGWNLLGDGVNDWLNPRTR